MPLCDDKVRGQMAPMQAGERNFDFYDTSGHAPFAGYRELMNSWILEFPENERVELVSRMKTGTNVQYEQALAEIIIYIALNRLGYKDPTRRPDFLARNQAGATVAYVEVTSFIQEFVSQPPIEAFDDGILDRLTRCDVVPFHLGPIRPLQDRVTGELAAIVADNHLRLASSLDDPVQLTDLGVTSALTSTNYRE